MIEESTFSTTWASPPGETIQDLLKDRDISIEAFAACISRTPRDVNRLLRGELSITSELANRLEIALEIPASFWIRRESNYRASLTRLASANSAAARAAWVHSLPIQDMVSFGWLPSRPQSTDEAAQLCLRYFGEPDLLSWRSTYPAAMKTAAFRTSPSFESDAAAVSAWLRQGEIEGDAMNCAPWNPELFKEALDAIRPITRCKDPNVFIPELKAICADAGVAVVIVRAPKGCRASGATRFLSAGKALLMLSFRYLSDDHLWFTFFHEAGHLLLHSEDDLFLEGIGGDSAEKEKEANEFAAKTLVPEAFWSELLSLKNDSHAVIRFARKVGISPGIIVGQLQHLGRLTHRQLNSLKRRYSWTKR